MLDQTRPSNDPFRLQQRGFEHYLLSSNDLLMDVGHHFDQIKSEFDALLHDPYDASDNRFRSYARGIMLPWKPEFNWIPSMRLVNGRPTTEYYQGRYNPRFVGEKRLLPAISEAARMNPLLHRLIWSNFDRTFWSEALRYQPLQVGVSFIKMQVDMTHRRALSTPDSFHQDGETFTFAHLVKRENVTGGINAIADPSRAGSALIDVPQDNLLAEFEISQPLETYAVFDPMVSHYVSPIELEHGQSRGERSVILIDFTPMVPIHHVVQ